MILKFLALGPALGVIALSTPAAADGPACEAKSFQIFFSSGLSDMTQSAQDTADEVVKFLAECSANFFDVSGHSDGAEATGSEPSVSRARADKVHDYLVAHGAKSAVFQVFDDGFTKPMVPSGPTDEEPLNRFVTIDIN